MPASPSRRRVPLPADDPEGHRDTRRPGRPGRAAAGAAGTAGQRELLLDAATQLFSERGVAATPVRAIAAHAGVTPALVHYYFRDRGQLLDAVASERLGPLIEAVFVPSAHDAPRPLDVMTGIAERMMRAALARPWLPGLWVHEIVSPDGQLRERVQRIGLDRVRAMTDVLAAARAAGELNPDFAPPLLMATVFGLAMLPLATRHLWQRLPGAAAVDDEALVRHVRALLAHGLAMPGADPADRPAP